MAGTRPKRPRIGVATGRPPPPFARATPPVKRASESTTGAVATPADPHHHRDHPAMPPAFIESAGYSGRLKRIPLWAHPGQTVEAPGGCRARSARPLGGAAAGDGPWDRGAIPMENAQAIDAHRRPSHRVALGVSRGNRSTSGFQPGGSEFKRPGNPGWLARKSNLSPRMIQSSSRRLT